eukprot:CAMPEP_0194533510 /NCGR_PEP_ID=MMETSP0253-20130528/71407_1 /TAXON_ID=2966 /ORGANISM="Noctiluca scintillans" /LENGTH=615 /DNA_ID=CAMNT_0039379071 /DNA_START=77 /DNA_END=1924 /DNA_ORIENTATION=-
MRHENWNIYEFKHSVVRARDHWEKAFHGTRWYALWLILKSGVLLESNDQELGHDFWEPGVYCSPVLETAKWYARPHIVFGDDVYHRALLELRVDPAQRRRCRQRGGVQWVFPPTAISIVAIWIQVNGPPTYDEDRFRDWDRSLEAVPPGCSSVTNIVNTREGAWPEDDSLEAVPAGCSAVPSIVNTREGALPEDDIGEEDDDAVSVDSKMDAATLHQIECEREFRRQVEWAREAASMPSPPMPYYGHANGDGEDVNIERGVGGLGPAPWEPSWKSALEHFPRKETTEWRDARELDGAVAGETTKANDEVDLRPLRGQKRKSYFLARGSVGRHARGTVVMETLVQKHPKKFFETLGSPGPPEQKHATDVNFSKEFGQDLAKCRLVLGLDTQEREVEREAKLEQTRGEGAPQVHPSIPTVEAYPWRHSHLVMDAVPDDLPENCPFPPSHSHTSMRPSMAVPPGRPSSFRRAPWHEGKPAVPGPRVQATPPGCYVKAHTGQRPCSFPNWDGSVGRSVVPSCSSVSPYWILPACESPSVAGPVFSVAGAPTPIATSVANALGDALGRSLPAACVQLSQTGSLLEEAVTVDVPQIPAKNAWDVGADVFFFLQQKKRRTEG